VCKVGALCGVGKGDIERFFLIVENPHVVVTQSLGRWP